MLRPWRNGEKSNLYKPREHRKSEPKCDFQIRRYLSNNANSERNKSCQMDEKPQLLNQGLLDNPSTEWSLTAEMLHRMFPWYATFSKQQTYEMSVFG